MRTKTKWILCFVLLAIASAAAAQTPSDAVIYIEKPEGGPQATSGRQIPSSSGVTIHGLDINSGVEVRIDPHKLAQALAAAGVGTLTAEQKALLDRLVTLEKLVTDINVAAKELTRVLMLFDTASESDFIAARSASSRKILDIRRSLRKAIADRLVAEGLTTVQAGARAANDMSDLGGTDKDWPKLRELVARELKAAEREFNALAPDTGVSLELQAHLVPRNGDPVAIALPGHNTVKPGPVSRFEKIRFEIGADQQELFKKFEELAAKSGEAKNTGEALLFALRSDATNSSLQEQLDKVKADFDNVKALVTAIDSNTITASLTTVKNAAQTNDADKNLIASLEKVVADAKAAKATLTQLGDVAQFSTSLQDASDPVSALNQILSRFRTASGLTTQLRSIGTKLQDLANDVTALQTAFQVDTLSTALKDAVGATDSPFAPLLGEEGAVSTLVADAKRLGEMVQTFFQSETTAIAVSNLPVPEGQKRIPVLDHANTSFNLQTIDAPRAPGDNVRLSYAFFTGESEVPSTAWVDTFDLRVYGLSDKVAASMALVRRVAETKFKPTAAMSWLLGYEPWPRTTDDRGRGGVKLLSGAGLTTMALDFDDAETVEIGVAPTISLLNDRLLLGYGWNLQAAKDRTFAFFSIQLLSRPGLLGNNAVAAAGSGD